MAVRGGSGNIMFKTEESIRQNIAMMDTWDTAGDRSLSL
jgi:hypothetical protein